MKSIKVEKLPKDTIVYTNTTTGEKTLVFNNALEWFRNGANVEVCKKLNFGNDVFFMAHLTTFTTKTHSHLLGGLK